MAVVAYNIELRQKGATNFSTDGTILYPKTISTMLYASNGTTPIFSSGKIDPAFLPDSIFDSLYYFGAISANTTLKALVAAAYETAPVRDNPKGMYWVATTTVTITANATAEISGTYYYITSFIATEGGGTPSSVTFEAGDWIVLDNFVTDIGGAATPHIVRFATVNNTYELATTTTPGIMSAADKTKLDGIATGANNYTHPTYTSRSIDTANVDVLDTFVSDTSGHVTAITTRTLPNATTSTSGVMSAADKTKLDGIASGADAYGSWNLKVGGVQKLAVGSGVAVDIVGGTNITATYAANVVTIANTYSYTHPAYTARSVDTSGVDVLDTFTSDASGHVTSITTRTLPNATSAAVGVVELAIDSEAQLGSSSSLVLTPSTGKAGAKFWDTTPMFASLAAADAATASYEQGKLVIVQV